MNSNGFTDSTVRTAAAGGLAHHRHRSVLRFLRTAGCRAPGSGPHPSSEPRGARFSRPSRGPDRFRPSGEPRTATRPIAWASLTLALAICRCTVVARRQAAPRNTMRRRCFASWGWHSATPDAGSTPGFVGYECPGATLRVRHLNPHTIQWIRVDGNTETDIPDATSDNYTLTSADVGKRIRVSWTSPP